MATLLSIVQDAVDELGAIARPSAVVASSDRTVQRLLALSNASGRRLAKEANWTILERLGTITTANGTEEYALPADYDRLIPQTEWDRTGSERIDGPLSAVQWETIKSGLIGSGSIGRRYRIVRSASGNTRTIRIDPTPSTDGDTLVYWYVSSYWCASSGGTAQAAWAADSDTPILDADLLRLDLVVRFKRAIGLDFASEADEYAQMLERAIAQDRPARVLNMGGRRRGVHLLDTSNIPETGLTG